MKIQNFHSLATTKARETALAIAEAGLQAVDTKLIISKTVSIENNRLLVERETFDLTNVHRIFVAAIGKCAFEASGELESILGDRLSGGIAIDVKEGEQLKKIEQYVGTHPVPSKTNVTATEKLVNLLRDLEEDDFVIFIVSGGGSTLLSLPDAGSVESEATIFNELTNAGATIQEINTVRKHLSLARGGRLAQYVYPARSVSLIFSDVPGDDIQFIASGPTIKDTTTVADAKGILNKYEILKVREQEHYNLVETPKESKYFDKTNNILVASNEIALWAMAEIARTRGFSPKLKTTRLTGEARTVAKNIVEELRNEPNGTALFYGGETTVTVKGDGVGGRNTELSLSALQYIKEGELVLALASDGRDNSDIAGALCDTITKEKAYKKHLSIETFLEEDDAYSFFKQTGDDVVTGETGSNVADLIIALKE